MQDYSSNKLRGGVSETKSNELAEPPLSFGERFEDAYEVILVLDNREQFATQGWGFDFTSFEFSPDNTLFSQ